MSLEYYFCLFVFSTSSTASPSFTPAIFSQIHSSSISEGHLLSPCQRNTLRISYFVILWYSRSMDIHVHCLYLFLVTILYLCDLKHVTEKKIRAVLYLMLTAENILTLIKPMLSYQLCLSKNCTDTFIV